MMNETEYFQRVAVRVQELRDQKAAEAARRCAMKAERAAAKIAAKKAAPKSISGSKVAAKVISPAKPAQKPAAKAAVQKSERDGGPVKGLHVMDECKRCGKKTLHIMISRKVLGPLVENGKEVGSRIQRELECWSCGSKHNSDSTKRHAVKGVK